MVRVADYLMARIQDSGVKHIFLLPGGGCMHLVDAVGQSDLEFICNLHEQACAIAAEAYAQYTNNLGVALVTTGPGGTNAVTGVAGAWLDSTPCLFLSGQVKRSDIAGDSGVRQLGPQEIDIVSIVKPITKYAAMVTDPNDIRFHFEKAVYLARSGRPGPVWLDIPLDVQAAQVMPGELRSFSPNPEPNQQKAAIPQIDDDIQTIANSLVKAKRPVILVGNGVRLANATAPLEKLSQQWGIPILTTWKATDLFPESYPLYMGRPGSIGQRAANFIQQNCDWILILGARLDVGQIAFDEKNFARAATKIMIDVDPFELKKISSLSLGICMDLNQALNHLVNTTNIVFRQDWQPWFSYCKTMKERYPVRPAAFSNEPGVIDQYQLVDVLSRQLVAEDVIVPGSSGACSEVFFQTFRVKQGQRVFNTPGLGAMGFGLPASIGACVASGKKRTICINGDGGFQLNIQELETVRRLQLPIIFFVLANDGYASIIATQKNYFENRLVASEPGSGLTLPDIIKLAQTYGIATMRISDPNQLEQDVIQALQHQGPLICEVRVSANQLTLPRAKSVMLKNGSMATLPMEDLWPFLNRKEFEEAMIIPPLEVSRQIEPESN